ncbi:MAG TPA: hypothetical protein VK459_14355, partial [Polyangiaceae bacterium]|nr:hypothetical protein [Polyangiaceae bacterium]
RVLVDYKPAQLLIALPVEVLKGLSDAYLDSLPEPTRAAIRARIEGSRPKASRSRAKKPAQARKRAARAPRK